MKIKAKAGGQTFYRLELKHVKGNVVGTEVTVLEKPMEISLFILHKKLEHEYNRKNDKKFCIMSI